MSNGTTTWTYTYNTDGMRKSRSNGTTTYNYVYNGGKLIQMTRGTDTLEFYYDALGVPVIVKYNGEVYNYVTTLQGDVLLILDTDGEIVVEYAYDAWGGHVTVGGSMASTLGTLNPLTYRGYVYDTETGLYYLQSRYYNPEIGRFINADAFIATGQGLTGNNMFAYCGNNPVNRADPTGHVSVEICISADGLSNILGLDWMGGCGSGGIPFGFTMINSYSGSVNMSFSLSSSDPRKAFLALRNNGFAFYKGCLVMVGDLPGDGAAFSYGFIVLDKACLKESFDSFKRTLNHEYGHYKHLKQVGMLTYTVTAALPSLTCAGLSDSVPWMKANYYSLPWERTADLLGGVERDSYLPGSRTVATIYLGLTWAVSIASGVIPCVK